MAGDSFDKIVKLGSGSYGNVWLVSERKRGQKLVLKEVSLRGLNEKDIDQALTEIQVLSKCKHQHIISYCSSFVDDEVATLSILMEHASMGDLHQHITKRRGLFYPDQVILRWFSQLVSALEYIHARCILHRDVKPQNLFLTDKETLKLGDFGISRMFSCHQDKAFTLIGTPFYLSPEVCRQEPYSYASDMWASGCVLYEMCCLSVPFTASNMAALTVKIELAQYHPLPSHCGRILHTLVQSLLTPDAKKRPTAKDILKMDLVHTKHAIDSSTYTVVKHPKKTRPSLASPELSALLHRQRSQRLLQGERAVQSAGNPRQNPRNLPHRKEKRSASPCFNLYLNECEESKKLHTDPEENEIFSNGRSSDIATELDTVIRDVYRSFSSSPSTPHDDGDNIRTTTATTIRHSLVKLLGWETFHAILAAVSEKSQLEDVEKTSPQFSVVKLLPLFLLYIEMTKKDETQVFRPLSNERVEYR